MSTQGRNRAIIVGIVLALMAVTLVIVLWYTGTGSPSLPQNQQNLDGHFIVPDKFLVGINYPWLEYGRDFGTNGWGHAGISEPKSLAQLENDFAKLDAMQIHYVRWFLFCDARAGIEFNSDGSVKGLDPMVFKDMDLALSVAARHHIMISFVLIDFNFVQKRVVIGGVAQGGHRDFIVDPVKRAAFIQRVFMPLFKRYGQDGNIVAWEVINEPEWVMKLPYQKRDQEAVPIADMQAFVAEVVQAIHANTRQSATLGSARRIWLKYWKTSGLDFYQYHYYPWMEKGSRYNYPESALNLDKPCFIGEFPTAQATWQLDRYLDLAAANGYAGAVPWSMRAIDPYTDFNATAHSLDKWQAKRFAEEQKRLLLKQQQSGHGQNGQSNPPSASPSSAPVATPSASPSTAVKQPPQEQQK